MIAGKLEHWRHHFSGPIWERAFTHILTLDAASPEGIVELLGRDMYARVMSYETGSPKSSKLEAHREYVDIQCSLSNGERIDWFPLDSLSPVDDYNPEKDVIHYARPEAVPISVCVPSGFYAVFFPEDAHMPKLAIDEPCFVKKVVVKVRMSLVFPEAR
jgi:biofilm protein TabA